MAGSYGVFDVCLREEARSVGGGGYGERWKWKEREDVGKKCNTE